MLLRGFLRHQNIFSAFFAAGTDEIRPGSRRVDNALFAEDFKVVHIEVGHANSPHLACMLQSFHIAPRRFERSVMLQVTSSVW
jgi:hypothetical protein